MPPGSPTRKYFNVACDLGFLSKVRRPITVKSADGKWAEGELRPVSGGEAYVLIPSGGWRAGTDYVFLLPFDAIFYASKQDETIYVRGGVL